MSHTLPSPQYTELVYIGDWQWLDFGSAPGPLDWVAFLVGGAGITVTLVQLFRSRGALKAAQQALEDTRSTLIGNQLVAILPSFRSSVQKIEMAIDSDDRRELRSHLEEFIYNSYATIQLLDSHAGEFDNKAAARQILSVATEAKRMRSLLFNRYDKSLREVVSMQLESIISIVPQIYQLEISLRNSPGPSLKRRGQ